MSVPKYRLDAIETIGRKILQEYDPALLDGPPQAVPIETIIETKFDLTLEYHCLRKNGSILGETIFDEGAAILYDQDEKRYRLIAVKAGTILVEERLCVDRLLGRLRFTCAHELGHWVLHQKLYSGTGDVAAYEGKTSLDESHGLVEWQADALATALLMPLPQIKRSFYRLRAGRSNEQLVAEMAQIFQVSKQAMRIRLETRNLGMWCGSSVSGWRNCMSTPGSWALRTLIPGLSICKVSPRIWICRSLRNGSAV